MKKALFGIILPVVLFALSQLAVGQAGASLNDQLIQAAQGDNVAVVQQLLTRGADIEARDKNGYTALIMASFHGRNEVVMLLLDKGANTEARTTEFGWTALILAAWQGKTEVVRLLLAKGANVDAMDNSGHSVWTGRPSATAMKFTVC
jgi:ankyrin repeat protein